MTTDIAVRGHDYNGRIEDYEEYDENSSARLFERSRIKALAGLFFILFTFVLPLPPPSPPHFRFLGSLLSIWRGGGLSFQSAHCSDSDSFGIRLTGLCAWSSAYLNSCFGLIVGQLYVLVIECDRFTCLNLKWLFVGLVYLKALILAGYCEVGLELSPNIHMQISEDGLSLHIQHVNRHKI